MEIYAAIKAYATTHGVELAGRIGAAFAVLVVSVLIARLARTAVDRTLAARFGKHRTATLAPALQSLARFTILGVGIVMALNQVGLNVATVLAGAGVLGIAIGFGAQTLVRDVISGFFLILDGVVESGDHVTLDQVSGIVEEIGLRVTQIRSLDGRLWYVPNGEFKVVGNFSRTWARALIVIPLPYEQDAAQAIALVQRVGDTWAAEHPDLVLEAPEAQGLLAVTTAGVDIRLIVKVRAMEHWAVERELARLIKAAFDEAGVGPAYPRQVVYRRDETSAAS